jgi:hypothetical protein
MVHNQANASRPLHASDGAVRVEYLTNAQASAYCLPRRDGLNRCTADQPQRSPPTTPNCALQLGYAPLGPNDALIAAHALAMNAIAITYTPNFSRSGLRVENHRQTTKQPRSHPTD